MFHCKLNNKTMDKKEFIDNVTRIINNYAADQLEMQDDPQLRINPMNLHMSVVTAQEMQNEIAYTDEAIDAEAAAEGDMTESSDDYEEKQDPDFYPLRVLLKAGAESVAKNYF